MNKIIKTKEKGNLIVISGPSGAGKGTVISKLKEINAEMFSVENNGSKVPIIKSIVDTNGISYIEVLFPADVLDAEDYLYLPFFADCSTNCGWNGKSWSVCAEEVAIKTGGIFAQLHAASKSQTKKDRTSGLNSKKYLFVTSGGNISASALPRNPNAHASYSL